MLFYRLQDKDYKLEEDWQSYYLNCGSLEEAMLLDIKEVWGMEELAERMGNCNWYDEDEYNVVEFEGEWSYQKSGMDGEDIADVIKEVRRIEISSFIEEE